MRTQLTALLCLAAALTCVVAWAASNSLTDAEKADGWKLLFDGKTLRGWHAASHMKAWFVEDGAIVAAPNSNDYLITNESFGDFILSVDFKEDASTNSGVFLRRPLNAAEGCRGIECQICDHKDTAFAGKHACGAVYDAVAPSKDACKGPGVWQNMTVECHGHTIKISLNGEAVTSMNLDEWTVAGKAPDGSPNKFTVAYKNMPRVGQLALQNHGTKAWFKNVKIKPLDESDKQGERT